MVNAGRLGGIRSGLDSSLQIHDMAYHDFHISAVLVLLDAGCRVIGTAQQPLLYTTVRSAYATGEHFSGHQHAPHCHRRNKQLQFAKPEIPKLPWFSLAMDTSSSCILHVGCCSS